jgi:hypothetical protein
MPREADHVLNESATYPERPPPDWQDVAGSLVTRDLHWHRDNHGDVTAPWPDNSVVTWVGLFGVRARTADASRV